MKTPSGSTKCILYIPATEKILLANAKCIERHLLLGFRSKAEIVKPPTKVQENSTVTFSKSVHHFQSLQHL